MGFLSGKIVLQVYTDTAQTEFPKELVPYIQKEFEDSDVSEIQTSVITLAALGAQSINFNGVDTVTRVYIYSDTADLSVAFNGLSALTYKAAIPGFMPLSLSSISITNASSTDSTTVTVILVKE